MPLNKKELSSNFLYSFLAQGLALLLSFIMTLVVPKILGIEAFSYWQLFIFYTQYGGFLHFGLNDGIYLREGGKEYRNLDFTELGMQYRISVILQFFLCVIISIIASLCSSPERLWIVILSSICILLSNTTAFYGYILQATNRIKEYSFSLIMERAIFIIVLISLLVTEEDNYHQIIILSTSSKLFSLAYCVWKCKEVFFSTYKRISSVCRNIIENIKVGVALVISNVSSMLILGIGRFLIDANFGIVEFGKISFAITLTNFFLVFMNQISLVLFPALRRLEEKEISLYYRKMNQFLSLICPSFLLLYPLIKIFIGNWLPDYNESIQYLVILFPLVCYDSKMQMVNNTFLKVSRKEKMLLCFNVMACIISLSCSLLAIFVLRNINGVIIGMLLALAMRCLLADVYLNKLYKTELFKEDIVFLFFTITFVAAFYVLPLAFASVLLCFCYLMYLIYKRKLIIQFIK